MSGQLPSPAPSDRRPLQAGPLSYEHLRAALAVEKRENAALDSKVTELEAKMDLLEQQVRHLEAEPWGKKKVRQLRERKRAREEAKASRAAERGEPLAKKNKRGEGTEGSGGGSRRRTSAELTSTAAIEVGFVNDMSNYSAETNGPLERLDLSGLPVEQKALLSEPLGEASPAAPEADVDMIDAGDDGKVTVTNNDDHSPVNNKAESVPSVEPNTPLTTSPVSTGAARGNEELNAKWKHGRLDLERIQEAEREIRSSNPSPLTSTSLPTKPFQASVSDALDSSGIVERSPMSLRGGAGNKGRPSTKPSTQPASTPYTSKATKAIQELVDYWAKTFPPIHPVKAQPPHAPKPSARSYSPSFRGLELAEPEDWPEELDLAGVTIIGEQSQDTQAQPPQPRKSALKFPAARSVDVLREEASGFRARDHPISTWALMDGLNGAKEASRAAIDNDGSRPYGERRDLFGKRLSASGRIQKPVGRFVMPKDYRYPVDYATFPETIKRNAALQAKREAEKPARIAAGDPNELPLNCDPYAVDSTPGMASYDPNTNQPPSQSQFVAYEKFLAEPEKRLEAWTMNPTSAMKEDTFCSFSSLRQLREYESRLTPEEQFPDLFRDRKSSEEIARETRMWAAHFAQRDNGARDADDALQSDVASQV